MALSHDIVVIIELATVIVVAAVVVVYLVYLLHQQKHVFLFYLFALLNNMNLIMFAEIILDSRLRYTYRITSHVLVISTSQVTTWRATPDTQYSTRGMDALQSTYAMAGITR